MPNRLQELRWVPPLRLAAAIAIQPIPGVEHRAALRPLLQLNLPIRLRHGEVLVVDPRDIDHREALLDDRLCVLDVEAQQADVP